MADLISALGRLILESPPGEWAANQLRELLIGALKQGPVPQHVGFVMDGNRRYAKTHRMETIEGHHRGFEALARIMEICYKCGVKVVTVYAFSIENFKRPKYEVDGLMQLAKVKLEQLTSYGDILDRYGASVRVLGQRDMIRADVLQVVDKAVARTQNNDKAYLNICFPYTSRAEITSSIKSTVEEFLAPAPPKNMPFSPSRIRQNILSRQLDGRHPLPTIPDESPDENEAKGAYPDGEADGDGDGNSSSTTLPSDSPPPRPRAARTSSYECAKAPDPENITEEYLNRHMYTADDPPLDLFIRTSGVERLSDFMLWQGHQDTHFFFLNCLWPEFDLHHFIMVLLEWQWRKKQMEREGAPTRHRSGKSLRMRQ